MATYDELLTAVQNEALRRKIRVAISVAADQVRAELDTAPNHAKRLAWARLAFNPSPQMIEDVTLAVVVQNRTATLAQITGATDAQVQAKVDLAIDVFAQ